MRKYEGKVFDITFFLDGTTHAWLAE